MAQERAAESWDCFPKFLAASLAACQSWYLCLIVITPLRADHYLAACLHFPNHFQKEIIRAVVLRRGLQVQLPAVSGSLPRAQKDSKGKQAHCYGHCSSSCLLFHPPSWRFGVRFSCSQDFSLPTFFLLNLHASSLSPVSPLTTTTLLSSSHWVTNLTRSFLGWRVVMLF